MHAEGRNEKRIPLEISVSLALMKGEAIVAEKATTVNISSHGVRLCTNRRWRPGEQLQIAPSPVNAQAQARVVYCQMIPGGRFWIGLELRPEFAEQWEEFLIAKQWSGFLFDNVLQNLCALGID